MATNQISPDAMRTLLQDVFPVETRLVGTENLEDLCAGRLDFTDRGGVFRMSSGESLAILANAVTVIAFLWQLFRDRRVRQIPERSEDERGEQIELLLAAEVPESAALPKDRRVALIVAVKLIRE